MKGNTRIQNSATCPIYPNHTHMLKCQNVVLRNRTSRPPLFLSREFIVYPSHLHITTKHTWRECRVNAYGNGNNQHSNNQSNGSPNFNGNGNRNRNSNNCSLAHVNELRVAPAATNPQQADARYSNMNYCRKILFSDPDEMKPEYTDIDPDQPPSLVPCRVDDNDDDDNSEDAAALDLVPTTPGKLQAHQR